MSIMTIRKANAERKLIDKKITEFNKNININSLSLVAYYRTSKPIIGLKTPKEVEEEIKSNWQRINDLFVRRGKLNDAVMKAMGGNLEPFSEDATNIVKVPSFKSLEYFSMDYSEYDLLSISQAVARKKYFRDIVLELLNNIKRQVERYTSEFKKFSDRLDNELKSQVNAQFGPESQQTAKQRVEYEQSIKPQYEATFIDPLKIQDKVEKVIEFVHNYIAEIDSIVSKATETTDIEVAD